MKKQNKFKVGDKANKKGGYRFPCTIVSVFETTKGEVRVVAEMDNYGILKIFKEKQLDLFNPHRQKNKEEIIQSPWPGLGGC